MASHTPPPPPVELRDEHIDGRKEWGRYVDLSTAVHRKVVAQTDAFLTQLRDRLELAIRRNPHP